MAKSKNDDRNNSEFDSLTEMINNRDIDQFIEFIKFTKRGNKSEILDLDPKYIDRHENGIEMFLRTAIKLEPGNPKHHYNYALFLETQHNYEQARFEFEAAIELDEGNDIYRTDYANFLFMLEDFSNAEKQYKTAIGLNPDNAHIWTNLGRLYFEKNEHGKAEKALKKAINIDPKFPLSYLNLLQLYENQGLENKAHSVWRKYQTLNDEIISIGALKIESKSNRNNKK
jgi:tetratricopeptide (TPR) repeat protein